MSCATSSFPVPVSPVIKTLASDGAIRRMYLRSSHIARLFPTKGQDALKSPTSSEGGAGILTASFNSRSVSVHCEGVQGDDRYRVTPAWKASMTKDSQL